MSSETKMRFALRTKIGVFVLLYCGGILFGLDLIYSNFFHREDTGSARISSARYSHGFAANYQGPDSWGPLNYQLYTNSLGFKDGMVRKVAAKADAHRTLLIGDSFTEGMGMRFEDSFAGMLYQAGQVHAEKIEFLNAAVSSYSPVIYLQKIRLLLESGFRFDELIVFLDISDIGEEATTYFCIDDEPRYRRHCDANAPLNLKEELKQWIRQNLVVLNRTRLLIKDGVRAWLGDDDWNAQVVLTLDSIPNMESSWTFAGSTTTLPPLGIEGGIARGLKNMKALADLLAERRIPLTIVVYPWPLQLAHDDQDSRHIAIWREFCIRNCKSFINLFPAFYAERDAHPDWYNRLFIHGDIHFSVEGHVLMFRELSKHLF